MGDLESAKDNAKVCRLIDFLQHIARIRSKTIRNVDEYLKVLWLGDIPRLPECFTQAWGRDEDYDLDVWVEVKNRKEPAIPSVPSECKEWVNRNTLRNRSELPGLYKELNKKREVIVKNNGSDLVETEYFTDKLEDNPSVQKTWDSYLENEWMPWVEHYVEWEKIQKIYAALFEMHQEQLKLGEEYELIIGLGLLTWKTPKEISIRRHLIIANAQLDFEARLGKFTVRPLPDGAKLRLEFDMLEIDDQPVHARELIDSALVGLSDDPWEKLLVDGVLKSISNSIESNGSYEDVLISRRHNLHGKPLVEYAPALILRKRTEKGLTDLLNKIKIQIENGAEIPPEFGELAEIKKSIIILITSTRR